jgi:putative tryptophan/tyrosine transport system substrate-binding protein
MRRRDFIKVVAGSAITWPLFARAQQPERMRRIGVLMGFSSTDLEGQARTAVFVQGLSAQNWYEGSNLRIDWRWGGGDRALFERYAAELVSLGPEVLVAGGSSAAVETLQQQTTTIPIVFVNIIGRIAFVRRIRSGCCARAAIGQLMAEPATTLMKSRRCIIAAMLRSTPDTH